MYINALYSSIMLLKRFAPRFAWRSLAKVVNALASTPFANEECK